MDSTTSRLHRCREDESVNKGCGGGGGGEEEEQEEEEEEKEEEEKEEEEVEEEEEKEKEKEERGGGGGGGEGVVLKREQVGNEALHEKTCDLDKRGAWCESVLYCVRQLRGSHLEEIKAKGCGYCVVGPGHDADSLVVVTCGSGG
ncbi:hypothetical protein Pmani_018775 [Petrolisthes manimaculis]|uniref:Uncharacterized protein n=1 Tax=Petrolisthes manimaculis TaxID=1843537 RepID=A0AAE1PKV8_9EUCA|nr:hypothetical protein Pmani_018775 [Petrolisthes manimaculis]